MSKKFDFKKPYKTADDFEEFVKEVEDDTKDRIEKHDTNRFLISLVTFLLLILIGLAGFVAWQYTRGSIFNQVNQSQSVLGASDAQIETIYSGEGFSILSKTQAPSGFNLTKNTTNSPAFPNKKATTTLLASNNKIGEYSIAVTISENDNNLSSENFATQTAKTLGPTFSVDKKDITIPKDIALKPIINILDKDKKIYTAVTNENYYYIVLTSSSNSDEEATKPYTTFMQDILQNLYLN